MKLKSSREIASGIDEEKTAVAWHPSGLFVMALDKTKRKLYQDSPKDLRATTRFPAVATKFGPLAATNSAAAV